MKKVCFPSIENLQIPKFKHNYGNAIFPLNLNSISSCNSPFFGGGEEGTGGTSSSSLITFGAAARWRVVGSFLPVSLLLPSTRRSTIPPNAPCSLPVLPVSLPVSLAKHWGALCGLKWWWDASSKITEGPRGVPGILGVVSDSAVGFFWLWVSHVAFGGVPSSPAHNRAAQRWFCSWAFQFRPPNRGGAAAHITPYSFAKGHLNPCVLSRWWCKPQIPSPPPSAVL